VGHSRFCPICCAYPLEHIAVRVVGTLPILAAVMLIAVLVGVKNLVFFAGHRDSHNDRFWNPLAKDQRVGMIARTYG
jgi:hypothetical protein